MELYEIETEQNVVSGLLRYPEMLPDVEILVNEDDFGDKENYHKVIVSIIKKLSHEGKSVDLATIASEIRDIIIETDFDFYSYLESLKLRQISEKGLIQAAKKLKTVSVRRDIIGIGEDLIKKMYSARDKSFDEIISLADETYGNKTKSYFTVNEPQDVFEGMKEQIEEMGDRVDDLIEIECPYPNYQKLFGGFYPNHLVVLASGFKQGKSTFLMNLALSIVKEARNSPKPVKVLMMDTELTTPELKTRLASEMTGIAEAHFMNGSFRKNAEMVKKVRAIWPIIVEFFGLIDHLYVGNATTAEMLSQFRRWHWKKIRNKNVRGLGILDYFKLTDKDGCTEAYAGSLTLGYRVDAFKKLATELQMPFFACCQTNASNEVGLSKEIAKFVTSLFLFIKRDPEEILDDDSGATHKLIALATRTQGTHAEGFNNLVLIEKDGRKEYVNNCIFYKLENFRVTEMQTLRERVQLLQHDDGKQIKKKVSKEEDEF